MTETLCLLTLCSMLTKERFEVSSLEEEDAEMSSARLLKLKKRNTTASTRLSDLLKKVESMVEL